ncbi:hypothetical protein Nepgr_020221 [Nepenthes gracilis]|uniref:Uncharacterized protein n=1 Tax=Nepenthes gracilis TaxID=150966 RepID=A0AAD3SV03_NEPGR|nr:hypothetical protein Nepgr_020221 [Nepenthes gracilis]
MDDCISIQISLLNLEKCWINRFANAGDAAVEIVGNTAFRFRQAKTEIVSAGKMAYRFLADIASNSPAAPDSGSPSRASPRFQAPWFKNLIPVGDKSSTSTVPEGLNQEAVIRQQEEKAAEAPPPPQTSHQSS